MIMKNISDILQEYDLISPYAQYKNNIMVHCVFHSDNTPSLNINLVYQNYMCFGCEAHGNIFDLIVALEMKRDNDLSLMQASIKARKILNGIEIVKPIEREEYKRYLKEYKKQATSFDEIDNVYRFYKSLEKINWYDAYMRKNNDYCFYLIDRGFNYGTLNSFHIRINATSTNPIVIPIIEQGKFKGYVARRIDNEKKRKYKNNNGLDKENILVGNLTNDHLTIVCEGMFDLMMSCQNDYENTCCILGCIPSVTQLEKIAQYSNRILWATDNDEAGDKGYRVAKKYYEQKYPNLTCERFLFPDGVNDLGEIKDYTDMYTAVCNSMS